VFTDLIDNERHVGYAYDLFGELLKLHQSQFFLRPPGGKQYNQWHPDGARALPYGVFSPKLPLQIKIGYWLTDLPREKMGNLVVLPGSHRHQYMDGYDTHKSIPGEKVVCPRKGTMTVMHSSIWHRVEPNESEVVRYNIFVAYCRLGLPQRIASIPRPNGWRRCTVDNVSSCEVIAMRIITLNPLRLNSRFSLNVKLGPRRM